MIDPINERLHGVGLVDAMQIGTMCLSIDYAFVIAALVFLTLFMII